ncbi:BON domain-containing protein [Algoriphagus aquatilis]|uniref:BON domain-containing protein n=1 Tax=Algoriphagus aquatilis TaxID=490186 RepID=A0ABW0C0A0_9BACT
MKTNQKLQRAGKNAIQTEQLLPASEIGFTAKDGNVSLTGVEDSYARRPPTEHAAQKAIGENDLVEKTEVKFHSLLRKTDAEIANQGLKTSKNNSSVSKDEVTVKAEKVWGSLKGEFRVIYQKESAKQRPHYLSGRKGVTKALKIKLRLENADKRRDIEAALGRSLSIDTSDIIVTVSGTTVTLTGTVNSWYQKEEAGRIASTMPGIWQVKNELAVDNEYAFT